MPTVRQRWMTTTARRTLLGCAIGAAGVALLTYALSGIERVIDRAGPAGVVLLLAVVVAAAIGRVVAGLVTTALAAAATAYYIALPLHSFDVEDELNSLAIAAFACVSVAVSVLIAVQDASRERAVTAERRTRALQEITAALTGAASAEEVARVVLEGGRDVLDADSCGVTELETPEGPLVLVASSGLSEEARARWARFELDAADPSSLAVRERRSVYLGPGDRRRLFPDSPYRDDESTAAVVPLRIAGGDPLGAIGFRFPRDRRLDAGERALIETMAEQCAQALERLRLLHAEQDARAEAEDLNATLQRMLEQVPTFARGANEQAMIGAVCRAAVESFGSQAASLWVRDGDALEMVHREPTASPLVRGYRLLFDEHPSLATQLAAGRPSFVPDLAAAEPLLWERLGRIVGARSQLRIPLMRAGEGDAMLFLSWPEAAEEPRSAAELAVAGSFADHAALAISEARRRAARASAAQLHDTLERSLLPSIHLARSDASVASYYLPGEQRLSIGGDFYDCVEQADGAIAMLIGDVSGHGPVAASLGAGLRAAWRALALAGASHDAALAGLDRMLRSERGDPEAFVTACHAVLRGHELTVALAGHPAPLIIEGGRVRAADGVPGPPLGTSTDATWPVARSQLAPGAVAVLYTDGLVEGRSAPGSEQRFGVERLMHLLAGLPVPVRDEDLQVVVAQVALANGQGLADDVAILALSLGDRPR